MSAEVIITKSRVALLLLVIIGTGYLFLSLNAKKWTIHPDDHEAYRIVMSLYHTGKLYYDLPLNRQYNITYFWEPDSYLLSTYDLHTVYPERSPGHYVILLLGAPFGMTGMFIVHSLIAFMGLIFLFLLCRDMFDLDSAIFSTIVLSTTPAYVLLSQFLFSNIISLSFFIGFIFFMYSGLKEENISYMIASVFLGLLTLWTRYDYIFVIAPVGLVFLIFIRKFEVKKILLLLIVSLTLGLVILATNILLTGNIIGSSLYSDSKAGQYLQEPFRILPIEYLINNIIMYFWSPMPFVIIGGIIGLIFLLRKKETRYNRVWLLVFLIITVFELWYYGKGSGFWGYNKNWLGASYTRYFLPSTISFAIFSGGLVRIPESLWQLPRPDLTRIRFMSVRKLIGSFSILKDVFSKKMISGIIICGFIIGHIGYSAFVLRYQTFGLHHVISYMGNRKSFDSYLISNYDETIFVDTTRDGYYFNMLYSVTVLRTNRLENASMLSIVVDLIENHNQSIILLYHLVRSNTTILENLTNLHYNLIKHQYLILAMLKSQYCIW